MTKNGVYILNIQFNFKGVVSSIHPVLIADENELILIDAGYPHYSTRIEAAAQVHGIELSALTKIIITHHDYDHIGSLAELKLKYPQVEIICSSSDKDYIEGCKRSLRLQQAESIYDTLPEHEKPVAQAFHRLLESIVPAPVGRTVDDKDILPFGGGIEIIATPGHMPGHISLYLHRTKTLVTGDAVVIENGQLVLPYPEYTFDEEEAKRSLLKLAGYDVERIICYHGGLFEGDCRQALREAAL